MNFGVEREIGRWLESVVTRDRMIGLRQSFHRCGAGGRGYLVVVSLSTRLDASIVRYGALKSQA